MQHSFRNKEIHRVKYVIPHCYDNCKIYEISQTVIYLQRRTLVSKLRTFIPEEVRIDRNMQHALLNTNNKTAVSGGNIQIAVHLSQHNGMNCIQISGTRLTRCR